MAKKIVNMKEECAISNVTVASMFLSQENPKEFNASQFIDEYSLCDIGGIEIYNLMSIVGEQDYSGSFSIYFGKIIEFMCEYDLKFTPSDMALVTVENKGASFSTVFVTRDAVTRVLTQRVMQSE